MATLIFNGHNIKPTAFKVFVLKNKQSKTKKKETKAQALPKVVKNDSATKESETKGSNNSTKGVKAEDLSNILKKDVDKSIHAECDSVFGTTETFTYSLKGRAKGSSKGHTIKTKIVALPESKILEVLGTIWSKNRTELINAGSNKVNANRMAGSTIEDFMDYLDLVIPDNYEPRNTLGKELKAKGSADWKLNAVNKEAVNRRMKSFLAKGSIIIYRIANKFHYVPTKSMITDTKAYKGSIWHIRQIRNVLYGSKQWRTGTSPYREFFTPVPPLNLTIDEFELLLAMDDKNLTVLWDKNRFENLTPEELGIKQS